MKYRLGLILLSFSLGVVPRLAHADALDDEERQIDHESAKGVPPNNPERLAQQFEVPVEKVNTLRENQGWGAVTAELALAQELAKSDPVKYPTTSDALAKVSALRAEKMGYGKIAQELGFKLGPVVSAARHERHELMKAHSPDNPTKPPKPDHAKPEPAHPPKPEHPHNDHGGPKK